MKTLQQAMQDRHECHGMDCLGVECAWPGVATPAMAAHQSRMQTAGWRRWLVHAVLALLLVFSVAQFAHGAYIQAKAWLAQVLIAQAWQQTLAGGNEVRPWGWADTWPVAKMSVPSQKQEIYVLAGSNGRTIAFGPGHVSGTALPGQVGNSVIGAHRDTHFAFLRYLQQGDEITLQDTQGRVARYRVTGHQVVDKTDTWVMRQDRGARQLTLVTCYPFDALTTGGRLRYMVTAEAVVEKNKNT